MTKATAIGIWDDTDADRYGDEIRTWHVGLVDDDGEPVSKVYNCANETVALSTAENMSRDRKLSIERYY